MRGQSEDFRLGVWNLSWVMTLLQATFRGNLDFEGTKGYQIVYRGMVIEEGLKKRGRETRGIEEEPEEDKDQSLEFE